MTRTTPQDLRLDHTTAAPSRRAFAERMACAMLDYAGTQGILLVDNDQQIIDAILRLIEP